MKRRVSRGDRGRAREKNWRKSRKERQSEHTGIRTWAKERQEGLGGLERVFQGSFCLVGGFVARDGDWRDPASGRNLTLKLVTHANAQPRSPKRRLLRHHDSLTSCGERVSCSYMLSPHTILYWYFVDLKRHARAASARSSLVSGSRQAKSLLSRAA